MVDEVEGIDIVVSHGPNFGFGPNYHPDTHVRRFFENASSQKITIQLD